MRLLYTSHQRARPCLRAPLHACAGSALVRDKERRKQDGPRQVDQHRARVGRLVALLESLQEAHGCCCRADAEQHGAARGGTVRPGDTRACSSCEELMSVATRQDAAAKPDSASRRGRGMKYLRGSPARARQPRRSPARPRPRHDHGRWRAHSRKFLGSRSSSSTCRRRAASCGSRSRSAALGQVGSQALHVACRGQRLHCRQIGSSPFSFARTMQAR